VDFNPWWFSGRDDLAHAFLRQLQAVLPRRSDKLKEIASLVGEFAEGIGGLLDLTGWTAGAGGVAGKLLGRLTKSKPKDVPALKAKIADGLRKAKVRILVLVDDIDRLDNAEVRQLFTVIKALADFP
jgi:predicted KAP-like P-loop ATPase